MGDTTASTADCTGAMASWTPLRTFPNRPLDGPRWSIVMIVTDSKVTTRSTKRWRLGRGLVEGDLHRVHDGGHRLLDGVADLGRAAHDGLGQAGDEVAAADLGVQLLLQLARGAKGDLDLLRGALTEGEAVLLLDVLDDRVVELVAADADRLAGDDAPQGDDRHLGGAAADVDHHVAGGLVHGQARADR